YSESRDYWLDRLPRLPGAPQFPFSKLPGEIEETVFTKQRLTLSEQVWNSLKDRAGKINITPTVLLINCFGQVINKWSKINHFLLNLTLFNRIPFHEDVNDIIGDFTSLTLLEMDYREGNGFTSNLKKIQDQLWNDLEYKYFSGVEVQRAMSAASGETVTIPVVVTSTLGVGNSDNDDRIGPNEDGFPEIQKSYSISQTPQVWIDCQIAEINGGLQIDWDSVHDLFPAGMLDDMFTAFESLLNRLGENRELWDSEDLCLIPENHSGIQNDVNDTTVDFPEKLMHQLFVDQVEAHRDGLAVRSKRKDLTYGELYSISSSLGDELLGLGAEPNKLIAVLMNKGWEQVPAVLGIQFSGAAYMPVDASLPKERINRLLEIGEVNIVVSTSDVLEGVSLQGYKTVALDKMDYNELDETNEPDYQDPGNLAYVIFTSGSTGEPKGVMIDHSAAVNTIQDINSRFGITSSDKCLALSSLSFDLSVYDVFGLLAAGGTIVIPESGEARDPEAWLSWLCNEKITIWNSVPALMEMLTTYCGDTSCSLNLKNVLLSGDWIPLTLPDEIRKLSPDTGVVSLGGATEGSIWSIFYPVETVDEGWRSIPYGKPLSNQSFHVLKGDLSPAPLWVPGELYIGGKGLARGYWKDDEKTTNSFIVHPDRGEGLYRTGDLGRYLPCGNIEFLGREDGQVKVQGYRIELGEIESALKSNDMIESAVVDVRDIGGKSSKIVAYIVPESKGREDSIGGLATSGNSITDKNERTIFKLKQHGIRKVEGERADLDSFGDTVSLDLSERYPESFASRKMDRADFYQIFHVLSNRIMDENPLPKYLYPSAGSLYPVQTYIIVGEGVVEGFSGCYYYNPGENSLVRISSEQPGDNRGITLCLVSDRDAIEPMYGSYSHDFCLLEAGYIFELLRGSLPENLGIGEVEIPAGLNTALDLSEGHRLLCSFRTGEVDSWG
ncbi:MAG: amino acid adenylation domain-containing protein, partial [Herbaspirillum sp.]|nr:amino acid adenylation domain-containing protein [Herbaspirillum sp.]